jgi:DNA-binding MarR family transcriptional regulator
MRPPITLGSTSSDFVTLISRAATEFRRKADFVILERFGVTYTQARAMYSLTVLGRIHQARLATILATDDSTVSRLVSRLVRKNLIRLKRPAAPQSRVLLELTDDGWALATKIPEAFYEFHRADFTGLPREDYENMRNLLMRLLTNASIVAVDE